jgi:redox-sensing transcriptional repressor
LFDVDPDLIGIPVGGIRVDHVDDIPAVCPQRGVTVGVVATPVTAAQAVTDRLVAAGVGCILNFAPVTLRVPSEVEVRKVDLAAEMQILSFHNSRRRTEAGGAAATVLAAPRHGPEEAGTNGLVTRT